MTAELAAVVKVDSTGTVSMVLIPGGWHKPLRVDLYIFNRQSGSWVSIKQSGDEDEVKMTIKTRCRMEFSGGFAKMWGQATQSLPKE